MIHGSLNPSLFELTLISSLAILLVGIYLSMYKFKYHIEFSIITLILTPLPTLISVYLYVESTSLKNVVLFGYSTVILSISLPIFLGYRPYLTRRLYKSLKARYFSIFSRDEYSSYLDVDSYTDRLVRYTYIILLLTPIAFAALVYLGYFLYSLAIPILASIAILIIPKVTSFLIKTSYVSGLDDELPQVIQILLIHNRGGETILEALENISISGDNLPYWSRLSRSLLANSKIGGRGIQKAIIEWLDREVSTERVRNFLEGYIYTWVAGGDLEAYLKRWLEDEQDRWVGRIRRYYSRLLTIAQMALLIGISPIAILLISFLNPSFGAVMIQLLIILIPIVLYIIPMVYLNSIKPRMADMPSYRPSKISGILALAAAIPMIYFFQDTYTRISAAILASTLLLIPDEVGWRRNLKRLENGVLRWVETSMHYMLAGVTPIDALKRALELQRDPESKMVINRLLYNVEVRRPTVETPIPLITHTLHIIGTGILSGGLSPDILHANLNTIYKVKRTIEESRANAVPAVALGILTPIIIWMTIGIGVWFQNIVNLLPPGSGSISIPIYLSTFDTTTLITLLQILSMVLVITIGAMTSKIYSNTPYSPYIYIPLMITQTALSLIGVDMLSRYFQTLINI